jgi:hypothetical protein
MNMLERLNEVNDVLIRDIRDPYFASYGRIVNGFDMSEAHAYMENHTDIPESGNIYKASVSELEELPVRKEIEAICYGSMPIEIGYCNGRNTTYNGFEYPET